jgi:hypothetical protein
LTGRDAAITGMAALAPSRLKSQPGIVAAEIRSALAAGRGRRLPQLRILPAR